MALRIEDVFFLGRSDAVEEGAALLGADEDIASGGEHERGHVDARGALLRFAHQVVEIGEKFQTEATDAVRDGFEIVHVGVVGREAREAGFAVDETQRGELGARGDFGRAAQKRDHPTGDRGAGFRDGHAENEALRTQRAVGHGIDRNERPHAFAHEMERTAVEVSVGKGGEVGPPFMRIEKMSAPAVVGIIALPAQIDGPHGEALRGELPSERTEIRGRAAQSVDAKDLRFGFTKRFPDKTGEGGAVVSVPFEGSRPAGDMLVGWDGGHGPVIFPRGGVGGKR